MLVLYWISKKKTKTVQTATHNYQRKFVVKEPNKAKTLLGKEVKYNIKAYFPFIPLWQMFTFYDLKPVGFGLVSRKE